VLGKATIFHTRHYAPAHRFAASSVRGAALAAAHKLRVEHSLAATSKASLLKSGLGPGKEPERSELGSDPESSARAYIGISGWRYAPWRGVFYPRGLRQASELEFASRTFSTIEINGSFYSLMRPETYQTWYEQTPRGFVFAVKGGRFITHLKRLKDVATPLANFFASGLLRLREKLGPILWQLPPQQVFDEPKLRAFFELLPRSTAAAAKIARGHDQRLAGRSETRSLFDQPLRHALEIRHPSFMQPRFVELLREYGVAACVADTAGLFPCVQDVTADFIYVRLHGSSELYTSGYAPRELSQWAKRIEAWKAGGSVAGAQLVAAAPAVYPRDVYVYFDNDVKVRAPFDAANLERLLNGQPLRRLPKTLKGVTETPLDDWSRWRDLGRNDRVSLDKPGQRRRTGT